MRCGVDIGGTNTQIGMVDPDGKVIDRDRIQTSKYSQAEDFVVTVAYSILRMADRVGHYTVDSIGVGCPNINPHTGIVSGSANLPFKGEVNLKAEFGKYFPQTPLFFDNDANAAAVGERIYGKAKQINDYIFLTLGTGAGGGVFCNGKPVYGLNGMAGEIGHMVVDTSPQARPCGCGRKGCLETYVGASGIYRTYTEICRKNLSEPKAANYREMTDLARNNDETALQTFQKTGQILGRALADISCVTAPTHIFVFGGVAQAGELLLGPVRKAFHENLLFCYNKSIKLELSGLMDSQNDAAVLGAAALGCAAL